MLFIRDARIFFLLENTILKSFQSFVEWIIICITLQKKFPGIQQSFGCYEYHLVSGCSVVWTCQEPLCFNEENFKPPGSKNIQVYFQNSGLRSHWKSPSQLLHFTHEPTKNSLLMKELGRYCSKNNLSIRNLHYN